MSKIESLYLISPSWIQSLAVYIYGKIQYQKRYSGIYNQLLKKVRISETWTEREIYDYQCEQMQKILRYCQNSIPYYHRLFVDYGITVSNMTSIKDLSKIPVLTKDTLRLSPEDFRSKDRRLVHSTQKTSGSTGTPLCLDVDEETYKLAMALLVNLEEKNNIPFGARRATFAGRLLKSTNSISPPFWKFNKSENQLLFSSYHLNSATFRSYREKLEKFQPLEIIGYPSSIYDLSNYYYALGIQPNFQPRLVITNSENLMPWQRARIKDVFNCPVVDYYSTAEYLNFSAENNKGIYKSNPLPGITELASLDSGEDQKKLIMTTLTNKAMPLLRYEVGDLAIPVCESPSFPGSPSLLEIEGRIDEYLETHDGRKVGRISQIFKGIPGLKEAQVVQYQPGRAIFYIVSETVPNKKAESQLIANSELRLGRTFEVEIEYKPNIPRQNNGKFRFVISKKSEPINSN